MNSAALTSLPHELKAIMATDQLAIRPNRKPDQKQESETEMLLTQELARAPRDFFEKLVHRVLQLSLADSAGISLLDEKRGRFHWPAVVGGLNSHVNGGTPSNFGPCGTVLELNEPILFLRPERYFTYLENLSPPLEEVLLIPFHVEGRAVGTIWSVLHQKSRQFQAEDLRLLVNLSVFASSAYRVLKQIKALEPLTAESA